MKKRLKNKLMLKLINFYPPFFGAGIKVKKSADGFSYKVSMNLSVMNRNYVGTHFGGSLYSMCDPFYMLIMMEKLGKDFLVWDKEASIKFKSPGRGKVHASFSIDEKEVQDVLKQVELHGVYEPTFEVEVLDKDNKVVAIVEKKLWIKKKSNQS